MTPVGNLPTTEKIQMMLVGVHHLGTDPANHKDPQVLILIAILLDPAILSRILLLTHDIQAPTLTIHLPAVLSHILTLRNMTDVMIMIKITVMAIQGAHAPVMTMTIQGAHAPDTPRRAHAPGVLITKGTMLQHPDLKGTPSMKNPTNIRMKYLMSMQWLLP
jgi:hypothetical protein